ncbi:FAD binding domain-containing protein [Methylobacterium gnaphalii]|uniref:FAD-binding molybdopterin dehydrogenase n=1 Tax=Methylobacterium gnaphalii TaxID=1010610 RepID=A0A512JMH7_9HYPH|nr:FAD binding domain-containing protein [Methylobacterium gnaphalii]GEP11176.1 FAD-binding molybdopterin dehydrogenase [Methylobacterium gnaphalii]GJD70046.1 hypothetical protein MMMDOFMJ_2986 [Methylobacterium gnaphalii]GLS49681.1 FAD-binding molybdopterin dehydrogenase [Methylobacterium gnaphalii]
MDLTTISSVLTPRGLDELPSWEAGDAWLAGGTWLFSEPQPSLTRLIDLSSFHWQPSTIRPDGLGIAATCTIAELNRLELPTDWLAAPLINQCCRALLGSFKIWNRATVGGNLCMALPAGPMIALTAALDGVCTLLAVDGSTRHLPVMEFVLGPQKTALRAGELLRSIDVPTEALRRRTAFRQISLSPNGRSGALLVGSLGPSGGFTLIVTASTPRPVRLSFPGLPDAAALRQAIADGTQGVGWYDDPHGSPDWRQHVTGLLAEEIRREFEEGTAR